MAKEILWGSPKFVSLLGLRVLWRDSRGQAFEVLASHIETTSKLLKFLRRDDVDLEVEVSLSWFITENCGTELTGHPAVDIELDAGDVSSGRRCVFGDVERFLDKELSLLFASLLPTLSEPGIFGFPPKELAIGRKFRVGFEELENRAGGRADEIEDTRGEEMVKALRSASWPGIVGEVGIGRVLALKRSSTFCLRSQAGVPETASRGREGSGVPSDCEAGLEHCSDTGIVCF